MNVTLSKTAWHARLQTFVYGNADLNNLCPYFWRTIGAVIFLPAAWLGSITKPHIYPDDFLPEAERRWGHRQHSNLDAGITSGFISFGTLAVTACAIFLLWALIQAVVGGFALTLLAIAASCAALFGLYHSADIWWPWLVAKKDAVCPVISWQE
jgi:hypothetical protein